MLVEGNGQINFLAVETLDGFGSGGQLRHRGAEWPKIVDHGLVDEHIAVSQVEDPFRTACLPQAPNRLKSGVGLASPGSHYQQDAVTAFGNRLNRSIDCIRLVIARSPTAWILVVV